MKQMRQEYPRPNFRRSEWENLNGTWEFCFDDDNVGLRDKWYASHDFDKQIEVPFVYQSKLSGIREEKGHEIVWYKRKFDFKKANNRLTLLHFGAVDYDARVWINGNYVGQHTSGNTDFSFDITEEIVTENNNNEIIVRVFDPLTSETITRGKQNWNGKSDSVWYSNSTGIWQSVWLEQVNRERICNVKFFPNIDDGMVSIEGELSEDLRRQHSSYSISILIKKDNQIVSSTLHSIHSNTFKVGIDLFNNKIFRSMFHDDGWTWTPNNPILFSCEFKLKKTDKVYDQVESYFGMREIKSENGKIILNNVPIFQKLVLNQGLWQDGLYTAPTDDDFKNDIITAKKMGFNGCRMHQKLEDPRFLYWADKLGFLIWEECSSPQAFSNYGIKLMLNEWIDILHRDFNHPSIITWVPFNESWGIPQIHNNLKQQALTVSLYHLIHSIDDTRLVDTTDGWEQTETDICGIHNYAHGNLNDVKQYEKFKQTLSNSSNIVNKSSNKWQVYAKNYHYHGEPIVLTECGGISLGITLDEKEWGYSNVTTSDQFIAEYKKIIDAINDSEVLVGFCYTQLYDIEQEKNGLLFASREPKIDLNKILEINNLINK